MERTHDIDTIRSEAEHWFARQRGMRCSASEQRAFDAWLADDAHAAAYAETQRIWSDMKALGDDADVRRWLDEAQQLGRQPDTTRGRPRRLGWLSALAAAVVLACAAGGWYALRPSPVARYVTARGEQRRLTLDDGSQLVLNTDTAVDVRFDLRERMLRLEKGEASFEVVHEARPFVVNAGGSAITDLGTRFVVRSDEAQTVVSVAEGAVAVARAGHDTAELKLGDQLTMRGSEWQKHSVDLAMIDGWTQGKLVFRGTPLVDVVAQANRYGPGRIVITDSSLDAYKISGEFRIGNNEALVRALQSAFPIQAESVGDETRLRRR